MKVLLCARGDYYRNFASDSIQVIKLASYLKKRGIEVEINNGDVDDYSSYDIIHLIGISRIGEIYKYYKLAHKQKKNIVCTPIYWDLTKYYELTKDVEFIKLTKQCDIYKEEILRGCNLILPNSNIERECLANKFNFNMETRVIYNGVDIEDEKTPLYNFKERYELDKYILCVGKISPEKNQLNLCMISNKLGVQLVLIGTISNEEYFKQCVAYDNVKYLGFMDSYNIYNAYRFAKLHILPAYYELPGLSSLEAAASGCVLVSTKEGSAKEYFKDLAIYCDPYDNKSIEASIVKGLATHKNAKLKNYVIENFSWEKSTDSIVSAYNSLLGV